MVRLSLVMKLWLAIVGLILVVFIPLQFALDRQITSFYHRQVTDPLLYHSHHYAVMLAEDPTQIGVAPAMAHMVQGEITVLDSAGRPIPFPGSSQLPVPAAAVQTIRAGRTWDGDLRTPDGARWIVTAVPIGRSQGAVILLAPAAPLEQSLGHARHFVLMAGIAALLLGTALALFLAKRLLRPVLAMERATVEIAQGEFSTRLPVTSTDEMGRLATAINEMSEQLADHDHRRREFLATVAHELRTPLTYIRGYAQVLAEGSVTGEAEMIRYARIVEEESIRLSRLVGDLLDMAQMDEGTLALAPDWLDLRIPIEQAAATIRPKAEAQGVALQIHVSPDLPELWGDGGRIQQVVLNLLDNGLKHTGEGGALTVTAVRAQDGIKVSVRDTGKGVPLTEIPTLFDRIRPGGRTKRGIGLAIVKGLVLLHEGTVGVQTLPGQGSELWFWLPLLRE
ncbi:MAG TPA: HAMP domain-containing sensor histidine kinase [Symbiobacteriaceae bacterium]|nr:HAMP domain-containing sensor histidine kinase [Symbiobacteriaceae bacterium]